MLRDLSEGLAAEHSMIAGWFQMPWLSSKNVHLRLDWKKGLTTRAGRKTCGRIFNEQFIHVQNGFHGESIVVSLECELDNEKSELFFYNRILFWKECKVKVRRAALLVEFKYVEVQVCRFHRRLNYELEENIAAHAARNLSQSPENFRIWIMGK